MKIELVYQSVFCAVNECKPKHENMEVIGEEAVWGRKVSGLVLELETLFNLGGFKSTLGYPANAPV